MTMRKITNFPFLALLALLLSFLGVFSALPAAAAGLFSPVVYVNGDAITGFELDQRMRLLEALRTPGDLKKEALKRLINERLQRQAGAQAGIAIGADEIDAGIDEFAQRVKMSGKQFLAEIGSKGVAPESFRDFVEAGLTWREVVRARFGPRVDVSDADIDRAIEMQGTTGSAEVLISEIFLPTNTPQNAKITQELAPQIAKLHSFDAFADAARRFSAGASRDRGGRVENWVPVENLPPLIRPVLLTMKPGDVTQPIQIPNAVALFQLRALRETTAKPTPGQQLEYASYFIPGGRSEAALAAAAKLRGQVDTCDDLYAIAKGQPANVLERVTKPLAQIPADIALELARLDAGESSVALTSADGARLRFLMLCSRHPGTEKDTREIIRKRLQNQRLEAYASGYLDELRANATITRP